MLDKEHEEYLRQLFGRLADEERIQKLVQELTIEEFWRRVDNLQQGIIAAKRQHYLGQRRAGRTPRRPS